MKTHIPNVDGFTPEYAGQDLTKKHSPGNPVGLKKKLVIATAVSVSLIVGFIVIVAFSGKPKMKPLPDANQDKSLASEAVKALPTDYSKIPRPKPAKVPTVAPLQSEAMVVKEDPNEAAIRKMLADHELQKMKRALKSQESEISFSNVDLKASQSASDAILNQMSSADSSVSAPVAQSARDDANRQDDKKGFLSGTRNDSTNLQQRIKRPSSPYQVLPGTVIPAVLLTGINSDLPGQISGQVSQNVFDSAIGRHLLIPQGTKVIGEYDSRVSYGQERVLIVWTRLIFPNGKSLNLEGMPGIDLSGYAGLTDQVNNHYGKILTGVIFGSMLGAGAQVAHGSNRTVNPEFGQLALEGAAQNINEAGQEITRKNLNIQPTLEIRPGFRFNVFVTKDITLEPYF